MTLHGTKGIVAMPSFQEFLIKQLATSTLVGTPLFHHQIDRISQFLLCAHLIAQIDWMPASSPAILVFGVNFS